MITLGGTRRFNVAILSATSLVIIVTRTALSPVWASPFLEFRPESAREYVLQVARAVLEDASHEAEPYFNLARVLNRLGQYAEAEQIIRHGLAIDPDRPDMYVILAEIRVRENKFDEAISLFRKAEMLDPNISRLHRRIGMALAHDGDNEGARREYEKELKRNPRDALTHFLLGQVLLQEKSYAKAEKHLEKACRLDPSSVNAFYALAQAQTRLGQREKARETLKTFRELKKKDMAAMDREVQKRDDEKALRDLARSVHMDAATFYFSRREFSKTESHLRRATELDSQDLESREALASLLHHLGRIREAISIYQEVVRINPSDAAAFSDLGTMYAVLREYEPAAANLEKALELDPNMPEALNNLTRLYLSHNKHPARALELAERLAAQSPSAANYDLLCWAYFANGRLREALEACAASIQLDPTNPRYRRRYARLQSLQ